MYEFEYLDIENQHKYIIEIYGEDIMIQKIYLDTSYQSWSKWTVKHRDGKIIDSDSDRLLLNDKSRKFIERVLGMMIFS